MAIQKVTVLGAGTMGNGIGHVFAQQGHDVTLVDLTDEMLEAGVSTIRKNLGRQAARGMIAENEVEEVLNRISRTTNTEHAVEEADLVVEAVAENRDVKAQIFEMLDRHCREDAIIASNTSSISITWLAAQTKRPQNVIGMHFFNPVPVMKLIEIVRGIETSDETHQLIFELSKSLGKTPVTVQDYPGFVSNRILMPMINEAAYCVMENIASVEDIDTVMKLGMAHPMGPLTLADFIGLDVCLSTMEVLHDGLGDDKYRPCPLLRKMVTAGRLGRKSGQGFYEY